MACQKGMSEFMYFLGPYAYVLVTLMDLLPSIYEGLYPLLHFQANMSSLGSSSSVESPLSFSLPQSFGTVIPGWRGVGVDVCYHGFLERLYWERPGTYTGIVHMCPTDQSRAVGELGGLLACMHEVTYGEACSEFFRALRRVVSELLQHGLNVSWLADFVSLAKRRHDYLVSVKRLENCKDLVENAKISRRTAFLRVMDLATSIRLGVPLTSDVVRMAKEDEDLARLKLRRMESCLEDAVFMEQYCRSKVDIGGFSLETCVAAGVFFV